MVTASQLGHLQQMCTHLREDKCYGDLQKLLLTAFQLDADRAMIDSIAHAMLNKIPKCFGLLGSNFHVLTKKDPFLTYTLPGLYGADERNAWGDTFQKRLTSLASLRIVPS